MKQQITKNAIETAFLKLLKDRNFEKVMVKDIVEECGLTRNTFYYYYEDTYNILADILEREIRRMIEEMEAGSGLIQASEDIFEFLDENPKIARHLFTSSKKDDLYGYIGSAVDIVVLRWIELSVEGKEVTDHDKRKIARMCRYIVQGTISEWVERGMKYSIKEEMVQLKQMLAGVLEQTLKNSKQ